MVAQTASPRLDVTTLTPAQRDGVSCVVCDNDRGCMVPVGASDGVQLFEHPSCAAGGPQEAILVVGNTATPDGLTTVTALAYDVASRMQMPCVVAMDRKYDVRAFDTVVYDETSYLDSVDSAVLWVEASEADMPVLTLDDLEEFDLIAVCTWCGETADDDPMPTLVEGVWMPAQFCGGCVDEAERQERVSA
ncbi:hypothetical protein ABZT27_19170 [Streptomyces sp. NPDC005389]|uniref:hypothetical protein n=1 Tax=Streptomyces sp. NPDC005389 TaxID=3157040 RepID=UPI0033BF0E3E